MQKYLVMSTNLEVAKVEEFIGRCYADHWLERSQSTVDENNQPKLPWTNQPFAQDWVVTQGKPHYPVPPDQVFGSGTTPKFDYFYSRAIPLPTPPGTGGVLELDDLIEQFTLTRTQQTLSDDSVFNYDVSAEALTWDELTPAAQAVVTNPG